MNKKICVILTAMLFVLAIGSMPATSADMPSETVSVIVNGNLLTDLKYAPIWNDLRTHVLIRPEFFVDYFDAEASVEGNVAIISKNGHSISFTDSEKRFVMNGIGGRNLDSANIVADGEAYIPLQFMCEALGASVELDENVAVVTIRDFGLPEEAAPYLKGVSVFDQATIRLEGEKVIYIDPYRIAGQPHDADIILVTHTHLDHFDIESIKKVMKDSAVLLIAGEGSAEKAMENGIVEIISVAPHNEYVVDGINIKTIPAYNTNPDRQNHRPEHHFVGYIVEINNVTYYAAGDTDYIEDMNALAVDVAFLPIDGRFNMDESEAARAANAIAPKVAVPYHYNNFSSEAKARDFVSMLDDGIFGVLMTFKMYDN